MRMPFFRPILLLSASLVLSFEIQDDCLVKNTIEKEKIAFDSLEFLSFIRDDFPITEVLMSCETSGHASIPAAFRLLNISPQGVNWSSSTSSIPRIFPAPQGVSGWTRLRLGLGKRLTLEDGDGHPWLPADLELGCEVRKVNIMYGKFTRGCSAGTPAWIVEDGATVDLPLQGTLIRDSQENLQESIILFSKDAFKPILSLDGVKFELGLRGGRLVAGGATSPLPPVPHHVVLETFAGGNRKTLKMLSGKHEVFTEPIESAFTSMKVSGGNITMVVVQRIQEKRGKTTCTMDLRRNPRSKTIMWFLTGSLVVMAVMFISVLVYHYHYRQTTQLARGRGGPDGPPRRKPPCPTAVDPAYLEPAPRPPHSGIQGARVRMPYAPEGHLAGSRSSSEHEYEEVDECFLEGAGWSHP
ncbi:uncharacterized protein LOC125039772 [Penaeus chinensis]|uniref:uncharacterized protein LOC125039772 n=1 Tax=Penaeus chinensis TaxID=139456 RepID=UPI001FB773FD|nr:uncharacterized protein LOC125039772 [Penaeus chinensis]